MSDHRCISFQLNISPPRPQLVKNWQRTDWNKVSSQLQQQNSSWVAPEHWCNSKLDVEVENFSSLIRKIVDDCTPTFTPKLRLKVNHWWNSDLSDQRKVVKRHYQIWIESGNKESHRSYVEARRSMKKVLRNAKVESWHTFCSDDGSFEGPLQTQPNTPTQM